MRAARPVRRTSLVTDVACSFPRPTGNGSYPGLTQPGSRSTSSWPS